VHADNSHHLAASATARSKAAVARALASIDALSRTGQPVTFPDVAKHAGVSRAFLYANEDVRRALVEARARTTPATSPPPEVRASDASLLVRLQQAHHRIADLRHQNSQLRKELANALTIQRRHHVQPHDRPDPVTS